MSTPGHPKGDFRRAQPEAGPVRTPEWQAGALLQEIERQAEAQRHELLDAAAREARAIAERARDKVRRQQQRALDELRQSERERTRQLRATLDSAARRQAADQAQELLGQAWPLLDQALAGRWADPATRAPWITALVALAASRLPPRAWVVRHPAHWPDGDLQTLQSALQQHGVEPPVLQPDASLDAGLVIEVDGARLDGTPAALLADRARIEAALLAALPAAARLSQDEAPR